MLDRTQFVGASDVPAIMGVSPFTSLWGVWASKLGVLPPVAETEEMRIGKQVEAAILQMVLDARGFGKPVTHLQMSRSGMDYFKAQPDAIVCLPWREIVIEVKNVGFGKIKDWDSGPPPYVMLQVQAQLACTDLHHAIVGALFGGNRFDQYDVARDQAIIDEIERAVVRFWDLVQSREAPPPDDSDEYKEFAAGFNQSFGTLKIGDAPMEADPEVDRLIGELVLAKAAAKKAKDLDERLSAELKARIIIGETRGSFGTATLSPVKPSPNKDKAWDAAVAAGLIPPDKAEQLLKAHPKKATPQLRVTGKDEEHG